MTMEERLENAFWKLDLQIQPGLDTTALDEYVTYFYSSGGILHGDDAPCLEHRQWSVVYVAPLSCDRRRMRAQIRTAIQTVTGIWPREDDDTDVHGQRFVYEFETFGGIADGEV